MQGQVDTLIPLLYVQNGTLEAAMAEALDIIKAAIARFDIAAHQLLERYAFNKVLHDNLEKFVHACRCACTANLNWRLVAFHP